MILSLKAGFFIVENVSSINEIEICYELDFDDVENDDNTELDEKEKIVQQQSYSFNLKRKINNENHPIFINEYRIQYLEFSTPPPEFLA
ncbi:hypothetical protein C7447_101160 [Tenacibaculum adriaticum]|uniref:Uncharacterized protein n=1 Tax=Tenacibaculum adriaticum TaxID=413713 RepID=A0A5S5DUC5_9FLAO|nr:hypothetical protein [Tenacibaculum adriaticum]TYP99560.1 hypothetical protein C7447_101160 [Tenacibaculum adriaticum]